MTNVKMERKGDKLHLEIDLAQRHGRSKSGKSEIVATTAGNVDVGEDIKLGLNCYVQGG